MSKVKSFDALSALKKSAQLQEGMDIIPDDMQNSIVPVIDITPRKHRNCDIVRSGSTTGTSSTLYTSPTDKDFFLTACSLSLIKDATSDIASNGSVSLSLFIDGVSQIILRHAVITLTAQSQIVSVSLPVPVKVDRGSVLAISRAATTVGVTIIAGTIAGYTVGNPQGN